MNVDDDDVDDEDDDEEGEGEGGHRREKSNNPNLKGGEKWSRLKIYVLGANKPDSSSKTTYIVLFPGLNSPIQIKISGNLFIIVFLIPHPSGWGC